MADVVQGIGRGEDGNRFQVRHGLHAQAAGDDHHVLGSLRQSAFQLLFGLDLVAQKVHPGGAGDALAQGFGQGNKFAALRLFGGIKFLEALVAGNNKEVVLSRKHSFQLFLAF